MKVKVNDDLIFELSPTKQKVIKNDIHADEFEDDFKRRLEWVIDNKYKNCFKRLQDEWIPRLRASGTGVEKIPLSEEAFAEFIFSRPEYKDRATREAEEKERRAKKEPK